MPVERLAYRVQEFAVAIGCSRAKTYELIAQGEIPFIKIGKSIRVPAAEGRAWIERKLAAERAEVGA